MREILFRGKRKDNGNWICGSFHKRINECFIIPLPIVTSQSKVDPETVGQFTGLTDKNGKKIFEGDIVRCIATMRGGKELVGYILYDDCCFCVKENRTANRPAMDLCDAFEVIGNIHDNPELLKVGAEDGK